MSHFESKLVVVTGASKGIGAATAELFLEEGARVALLDIDDKGKDLTQDYGEKVLFINCDVSKGMQVEEAFEQIEKHFGGVDILINNAGVQRYSKVTETSEEEWDYVLSVNLKSAFLCSKHALPAMQEQEEGVVVNVASAQSFISQREVAPYTTSKTALLGLTRSIAVDYAPEIRCVAVCPGTVDTSMLCWAIEQSTDAGEMMGEVRQMHLMQRIAKPEEVASLIGYLCSEEAAFITGQAYRIDGGLGIMAGGSAR